MEQREVAPAERPPLLVIVAANVRFERLARTWSQERLAREAGLSRNTIAAVEDARDPDRSSNALRLDTLERIAIAFKIKADELLRWKKEATRAFFHAVTPMSEHLVIVESAGGRRSARSIPVPRQLPLTRGLPPVDSAASPDR